MRQSQLNSLVLPIAGSENPATLMKAALAPLRVVVRNIGPGAAVLAHDPGTLSNVLGIANTFTLPQDREDTFVLAPGQGIYAVGQGVGIVLCLAISEAIPLERH
jgi:hypothetical protein